jgi:hypothetical protein
MSDTLNNELEQNALLIGYVVGGGLKENLRVRLSGSPQAVQEGAFVVIDSNTWRFFGLVTDLQLGATDPRFADEQSEGRFSPDIAKLLVGQTLYTNAEVMPQLMMDRGPDPLSPEYSQWVKAHPDQNPRPLSVKTIPAHHALVRMADSGDIEEIFGKPDDEGNFIIGYTREQNHPLCINLDKMIQRSSGIFGATGTGKSFLTRIILAGLIKRDKASILVFDMHNEYGLDDTASDTGEEVKGLRTRFGTDVQVVGLGKGTTIRGQTPDYHLEIAESDIHPEDIELLTKELNLKETTPTTLEALVQTFGKSWFHEFKHMNNLGRIKDETGKPIPAPGSVDEWASNVGVNVMAAQGLHDKLRKVFDRPYIAENIARDTLQEVTLSLQKGKHVILSFGDFDSDLDYLLVTNLITRRIRDAWEKQTDEFRAKRTGEPRPLTIVLEEAHKLLNREMASQTTFSTIARELRKYYVTLLIVDQRPSQIYDEVMSQLGTRVTGWLGDDSDIASVLSGLAAKDSLRGMLARLQPKEEVLMLGWSMPMPMLVRTRRYDERFWRELGVRELPRTTNDYLKALGFN